jgi:hypothetical protein
VKKDCRREKESLCFVQAEKQRSVLVFRREHVVFHVKTVKKRCQRNSLIKNVFLFGGEQRKILQSKSNLSLIVPGVNLIYSNISKNQFLVM